MTGKVLLTGASGFLGRNLITRLQRAYPALSIVACPHTASSVELNRLLRGVSLVFHLAGVNRPEHPQEFASGNNGFTAKLTAAASQLPEAPAIVFASSTQAALDNPYGLSKKGAEDELLAYAHRSNAKVANLRFTNIFGKWSRPNYNSVVATFCHNIIHGHPVAIHDRDHKVRFIYVDDAVTSLCSYLEDKPGLWEEICYEPGPTYEISLGDLAKRLLAFNGERQGEAVPDFSDPFTSKLYATFTAFQNEATISYLLEERKDPRGSLVEFVKSHSFGQIFVSVSKPCVVRGNHYHDTKVEKFLVVQGQACIRIRLLDETTPWVFEVSGDKPRIVTMPPGSTHSIENTGSGEMILLVWASEVFDPQRPDTFASQV